MLKNQILACLYVSGALSLISLSCGIAYQVVARRS